MYSVSSLHLFSPDDLPASPALARVHSLFPPFFPVLATKALLSFPSAPSTLLAFPSHLLSPQRIPLPNLHRPHHILHQARELQIHPLDRCVEIGDSFRFGQSWRLLLRKGQLFCKKRKQGVRTVEAGAGALLASFVVDDLGSCFVVGGS